MKKSTYYLILLSVLLSCNNNSRKESAEKVSEKTIQNTKKYELNSDCKVFFESIDFSSFCFSNDKTPKFEVGNNYGISSRCQYRIYSDKNNFDFLLLVSTSTDEFEMIMTRFDVNKKTLKLTGFNNINDISDLGDHAYIALNESNHTKEIHVISGNLAIKIELSNIDKHKSCLYEDAELKRVVSAILKSLA